MPAQIQPSSHPPVLLIESEKPLRARLTDILEGEHLTPICCETGAEALDACIRFEVHVAVLNLCVSDSDGLRLLDQLLACRRELKVIVHTGEAVLDSADMALHRGAFAYVQQLNGVDALLAQVHRAFHRHLADDREKLQFEIQRQTQALGEANRALKRLERVSLELSEREQRRFGRALHDGLGQLLTGAALNSKLLEAQLAKQVRPEAEQATQLVAIVNQAIRQTQDLIRATSLETLKSQGLSKAIEVLVAQVNQTVGPICEFQNEGGRMVIIPTASVHLYRMIQEALANAIQHAQATSIVIRMSMMATYLCIEVEDNGIGISDPVDTGEGRGVHDMRTRATLLGATLNLIRRPTGGTRIECFLPLDRAVESVESQGA